MRWRGGLPTGDQSELRNLPEVGVLVGAVLGLRRSPAVRGGHHALERHPANPPSSRSRLRPGRARACPSTPGARRRLGLLTALAFEGRAIGPVHLIGLGRGVSRPSGSDRDTRTAFVFPMLRHQRRVHQSSAWCFDASTFLLFHPDCLIRAVSGRENYLLVQLGRGAEADLVPGAAHCGVLCVK